MTDPYRDHSQNCQVHLKICTMGCQVLSPSKLSKTIQTTINAGINTVWKSVADPQSTRVCVLMNKVVCASCNEHCELQYICARCKEHSQLQIQVNSTTTPTGLCNRGRMVHGVQSCADIMHCRRHCYLMTTHMWCPCTDVAATGPVQTLLATGVKHVPHVGKHRVARFQFHVGKRS
jgi:hypothetical protein